MLLADLGADVILVERPGSGDPSRRFTGLFAALNRNKRSIVLNLKNPQDKDRFLQLVDGADVVVEGFRPGVMQRLGLDAAVLRERKPALIYASISSFGQHGPLSGVVGHDLSIQAAAGMIKVPLGQESRGSVPVLPMADISSGMFAAFGILAGLFSRSQTKAGCTLDVSMLDSLVSWMTPFLVPPVNGLPVRDLPPLDPGYGIFSTRDGRQITLSIAGEDAMWASLCELLGMAQYATLTEHELGQRADEIDPVLRKAIAQWQLADLYPALEERGIAFGPVIEASEVLKQPQLVHRGIVAQAVGPLRQTFVRQPVLFDSTNFPVKSPAPALGQHTQEILASLAPASSDA